MPPIPSHGDRQTHIENVAPDRRAGRGAAGRIRPSEERRQLAHRFIIDARQELETDNRLQAGEKAWGAVAQMFKIAAEQRGWRHFSHRQLEDIGRHLLTEYPEYNTGPLANALNDAYRQGHQNFYENWASPGEVEEAVEGVERFLPGLDAMASAERRPFDIASNAQRDRLRSLTGDDGLERGDRSEAGFSLRRSRAGMEAAVPRCSPIRSDYPRRAVGSEGVEENPRPNPGTNK